MHLNPAFEVFYVERNTEMWRDLETPGEAELTAIGLLAHSAETSANRAPS